jgi:hypothetical protein
MSDNTGITAEQLATLDAQLRESTEVRLYALVDGEVSEARRETLRRAIELGASDEILTAIMDAVRVNRNASWIALPPHHYESLSRGRGWCGHLGRRTRGSFDRFAEEVDGQYRADEPGRWRVGASDGFTRKGAVDWVVAHVVVGDQTWTVAS